MELLDTNTDLDQQIARRLHQLRMERGWSLDSLAQRSGVSRATLSRLENAAVSPTTQVLNRLCAAFGMTMSRLLLMVEDGFAPLVTRDSQAVWHDPQSGFERRSISPPAQSLAGEALECSIAAGQSIHYERAPRPGLEHHLVLLEGELMVTLNGMTHHLMPGDCLRYQLFGESRFQTPPEQAARYLLFMV